MSQSSKAPSCVKGVEKAENGVKELRPTPEAVQKALDDCSSASHAEASEKAKLFSSAIQLAAAGGRHLQAVELLEEMVDKPDMKPDLATFLAGIRGCELGEQPLERAWALLDSMRKIGLELDQPSFGSDNQQPTVTDDHHGNWAAVESHGRTWLRQSLPLPHSALQATVRIGCLLRHHSGSYSDNSFETVLAQRIVDPVVQALIDPVGPNSQEATILRRLPSLGLLTSDVLEALGHLHTGDRKSVV